MKTNNTLLVGPWVGEFGWELFCFQGYVRKYSKSFDKVIVIGKKGHDFLYKDFCDEYIHYSLPEGYYSDSWFSRDKNMRIVSTDSIISNKIKEFKFTHRLDPNKICSNMFLLPANGIAKIGKYFYDQEFIKYESNTINEYNDIILHPRNKGVGDSRNWGVEKWNNLVKRLKSKYTIGVIGNNESFKLEGVNDYRNLSIEDTVSVLNRAKLVVGQSSGPLHLASLSGIPQLVWSTEHNRVRYEKYWNPFNISVYFYSDMNWNPTVDFIYDKILKTFK